MTCFKLFVTFINRKLPTWNWQSAKQNFKMMFAIISQRRCQIYAWKFSYFVLHSLILLNRQQEHSFATVYFCYLHNTIELLCWILLKKQYNIKISSGREWGNLENEGMLRMWERPEKSSTYYQSLLMFHSCFSK